MNTKSHLLCHFYLRTVYSLSSSSSSLSFSTNNWSSLGAHSSIAMLPGISGIFLDSIVAVVVSCFLSSAASIRARSANPFSFSPFLNYICAIFIHFLSRPASITCCFNSFVIVAMPSTSMICAPAKVTLRLLRSAFNFASFFAFFMPMGREALLPCAGVLLFTFLFFYFQYCSSESSWT